LCFFKPPIPPQLHPTPPHLGMDGLLVFINTSTPPHMQLGHDVMPHVSVLSLRIAPPLNASRIHTYHTLHTAGGWATCRRPHNRASSRVHTCLPSLSAACQVRAAIRQWSEHCLLHGRQESASCWGLSGHAPGWGRTGQEGREKKGERLTSFKDIKTKG
jgi:hypothetical protein